jgi:hypothetical protein
MKPERQFRSKALAGWQNHKLLRIWCSTGPNARDRLFGRLFGRIIHEIHFESAPDLEPFVALGVLFRPGDRVS